MSDLKLKSGFWVRATVRRCAAMGVTAVIGRMGDEDSGAILVKFYRGPAGCQVFSQVRDAQARLAWMCVTGSDLVPEAQADQILAKAVDRDSDLWVLEIEDRMGSALVVLENVIGG